ncbi:MAG TPA: cupin domain-containing protein [Puia sp.]|nr:cupin domain-containing protein [Puia sp.]
MVKCINRETRIDPKNILLPLFMQPNEDRLEPGPRGVNMRVLVKSSQTNYQFACVEMAMAPKKMGPAPHIHEHLDEISYVLEGTLGALVGSDMKEINAGGFSLRPHGIAHSVWNPSDKPLRFFEIYCNQNFDEYLEDLFFKRIAYMTEHHLSGDDPLISKWARELHDEFGLTFFPEQSAAIMKRFGLSV